MRNAKISLDLFGDRYPWEGYDYSMGDNNAVFKKMKQALLAAMENELTDCQKQVVNDFYFLDKTITAIAAEQGVNKSTVSRHLSRARIKLKSCLKYGFYPQYK